MQTHLRHQLGCRLAAAAAAAVAIPALAGCGFGAQTDQVYQPAPGVNDRSGQVDVLGALVVSAQPGSGVFIATLSNNDQSHSDQLVNVQANGANLSTGVTPAIDAGGMVNLASGQYDAILVTGSGVTPGGYVSVRLTFANADPVTVKVPVLADDGPYAGLVPSDTPNTTAANPAASPNPGSSSPAASPSGSARPSSAAPSATASTGG